MKDTNKILEKERFRNVVNALIMDALETHLFLKYVEWLPKTNNWSQVLVMEFYTYM